jgi:hypothetical protein
LYCVTDTVFDGEHPSRPSKITEQNINKVHNVIHNEPQSSFHAVATACSIPQTITYRIMYEYLPLKLFKVQFVEQLR